MKWKKAFFLAAGILCTGLGFLGMILPLLPTTPFLLLAAFCYARSSKKFYIWLMTNPYCGTYIRNYRDYKGMTRGHKSYTLILLWATLSYSIYAVPLLWVDILLVFIGSAVSIHLLCLKSISRQ